MAQGTPNILLPFAPARASVWCPRSPNIFRSPWDGTENRYRRFHKWKLVFEYENLEPDDFDDLMALFDYYGSEESFTIYNPERPMPRGNATPSQLDSLLVAGGSQVGKSLIVDGAPNNTLLFKKGDFVGLQNTGQAFRIRADCTSNGSGVATILLNQYIGASPANNEPVVVSYVPIRVFLDRDPREATSVPELHDVTFEMTEA